MATLVKSRSAASAVCVIPSRRDRNASTHHWDRVIPSGLRARSTTMRRKRDTSWIKKPKRRLVLRSFVTHAPCQSNKTLMIRSSLQFLHFEMPLEHVPRDDRFHYLDRTTGDFNNSRVGVGTADRIFPHVAPATE